jgi:hypothetical protein
LGKGAGAAVVEQEAVAPVVVEQAALVRVGLEQRALERAALERAAALPSGERKALANPGNVALHKAPLAANALAVRTSAGKIQLDVMHAEPIRKIPPRRASMTPGAGQAVI